MAFTGDFVDLKSYYPAITRADELFSGDAFIANGVTFSSANLHVFTAPPGHGIIVPTVSFGPSTIDIQYSPDVEGRQFSSNGFNGLVFTTWPTDQPIGEADVVQTNIPGLTTNDVTVTAHSIAINVQGLSLPAGTPGEIQLVASFGPPFLEITAQGHPTTGWATPQNISVSYTGLPAQYRPLLFNAEQYWEHFANIHFNNVTGAAAANADIQVGLASLGNGVFGDTPMRFIGNNIAPPVHLSIDSSIPTTRLANGDYQYQIPFDLNEPTVFGVMMHELGHALGLGHNNTDLTSIMAQDPTGHLIDATDQAAIRGLYGAPTNPPPIPAIAIPGESGF